MSSGSRKIREERMTAFEGMKAIMEKIDRGERLSVEEKSDFDARNARITELDKDLRTAEAAEKLAEQMRSDEPVKPQPMIDPGKEVERAFTDYLRRGDTAGLVEARDMGTGTLGPSTATETPGYLVPPGWWQRLQIALRVYGGIANDYQPLETETGQSVQWAVNDPTAVVGSLISENATVGTVDYSFMQGVLNAYMFTSGIQRVSIQLANDSAFDIDTFVSNRVGESLGRALAAEAVGAQGSGPTNPGSGNARPLGIINALTAKGTVSSVGTAPASAGASGGLVALKAGQPVYFGGTASASTEVLGNTLSVNTLRTMIASVDPAYRAQGAKFYMNDAQLLGLRGQTDLNGRPLVNLQDGVTPGVPASIWGYPVVIDNNIPNLADSTVGGPVFGHVQSAMILRTVNQSGLLRLDQRFADQLQIGYIGFMRFDIRSNDLRAAVTVSAGTS